jgi:hypothetical protein
MDIATGSGWGLLAGSGTVDDGVAPSDWIGFRIDFNAEGSEGVGRMPFSSFDMMGFYCSLYIVSQVHEYSITR